jgi:hypothetical protein
MRFGRVVAYIFSVFTFLTIGSLMVLVALHVITMEDALLRVQTIYEHPWESAKIGFAGVACILMGLAFSKILVKETRSRSDMILLGKWGYVSISTKAVKDLIHKCVGKFDAILEHDIKVDGESNRLSVLMDVDIQSDCDMSSLTHTVQNDLSTRLSRLVGDGVELDVSISIRKIVGDPIPVHV